MKVKLIIGILVFLLFLVIGFCATSQQVAWLIDNIGGGSTSPVNQANYLIIHVDGIENDNPKVINIWGVFIYLNDPVSIKVKPLYPSANPQGDVAASFFALSSDGLPSPEFITVVKSSFNIPVDNYLLFDDHGAKVLNAWANNLSPESVAEAPAPTDIDLFQSGCAQVQQSTLNPDFSPDWALIIPNHFRTNFNFDQFITHWKTISSAGAALSCEVLTTP